MSRPRKGTKPKTNGVKERSGWDCPGLRPDSPTVLGTCLKGNFRSRVISHCSKLGVDPLGARSRKHWCNQHLHSKLHPSGCFFPNTVLRTQAQRLLQVSHALGSE